MRSDALRDYHYFKVGTMPDRERTDEVMAMGEAVRFAKRPGKEFVQNLIWFFVAYVPLAAILTVFAGVPLRGVLVFGGVFVPVTAVITALIVWVGGPGDYQPRESHPDHHPGGSHPGFFSGGDYGVGGGGDFGGGGGGGGDSG